MSAPPYMRASAPHDAVPAEATRGVRAYHIASHNLMMMMMAVQMRVSIYQHVAALVLALLRL